MTRRTLTVVFFCFAIAQAKPNFSGTWSLNLATSDFGPAPKPEKVTTTIEHAEPNLRVSTDITGPQGQRVTKSNYTTDGAEVTNVNGPVEMKSKAKWDGDVLVIESKGKFQDNELTIVDKWSLSSGGKTVKQTKHIVVQQGEFDQTYVYDKQ
jgi:hypothetical protein